MMLTKVNTLGNIPRKLNKEPKMAYGVSSKRNLSSATILLGGPVTEKVALNALARSGYTSNEMYLV